MDEELDGILINLESVILNMDNEQINEKPTTIVDTPNSTSINDLIEKVKSNIPNKIKSIDEAKEKLEQIYLQTNKINTALLAMADCSIQYANGNIDDSVRMDSIKKNLEDIRVPVKELQLQLGRKIDPESNVTEEELRDFQTYCIGLINAFKDYIGDNEKISIQNLTSNRTNTETNIKLENDGIDLANKFASTCESLCIPIEIGPIGIISALESLLSDIESDV